MKMIMFSLMVSLLAVSAQADIGGRIVTLKSGDVALTCMGISQANGEQVLVGMENQKSDKKGKIGLVNVTISFIDRAGYETAKVIASPLVLSSEGFYYLNQAGRDYKMAMQGPELEQLAKDSAPNGTLNPQGYTIRSATMTYQGVVYKMHKDDCHAEFEK